MSNNKIIAKIDNLITKYGIPYYVKAWEKRKKKISEKFNSYPEFIYYLNTYVKEYHPHSFIQSKSRYNEYNKSIKMKVQQLEKEERPMPTFKYDQKRRIATITFYHFYTNYISRQETEKNSKKLVKMVEIMLKKWNVNNLNGLIIDLRKHHGGNMWPAIESLKMIIGDNVTLLSFNNVKTKLTDKKWVNIENGKFKNGEFLTNKLKYEGPIAVIVSEETASSGEFITAVFYGRENVKIFGDKTIKTAGYLSSNTSFRINNDITFNMTNTLCTSSDGTFHLDEYIYADKKRKHP